MKRIAIILNLLLFCQLASAQSLFNVELFKTNGKTTESLSGIDVYTFSNKKKAEAAADKLNPFRNGKQIVDGATGGDLTAKDGVIGRAKYNGRLLQIKGYYDGYLVIDNSDDITEVIFVKDYLEEKEDGYYFRYTLKVTDKNQLGMGEKRIISSKDADENSFMKDSKKLRQVDAKGARLALEEKAGSGDKCGHTISFEAPVNMLKDYTRTDARFVVVPYLVEVATGDTLFNFLPTIVDGKEYHKSNHRHKGYKKAKENDRELDQELHDKLGPYVRQDLFMDTRSQGEIIVSGVIENDKIHEEKMYKVLGHIWYEDFNTVFHEDNKLLWDGNTKSPKRYLDWKQSIEDIAIDSARYHYEQILLRQELKRDIQLNFVGGKADLKDDSITQTNLMQLVKTFNSYSGEDGGSLVAVKIQAFSSPEGGEEINRKLSRERSATIVNELRNRVRIRMPEITPIFDVNMNIVPWDSVAAVLSAMDTESTRVMAEEIRQISARYRTMNEKYSVIRTKAWYPFVRDSILPELRRVKITWQAEEFRIIPSGETYERFRNKYPGYYDCSVLKPYQYYQLLNRLSDEEDWVELERVARLALQNPDMDEDVFRTEKKDTLDKNGKHILNKNGKKIYVQKLSSRSEKRHYPLAAYYLSKCLIHKEQADTTLLKPYMDFSTGVRESDGKKINMNRRRNFGSREPDAEWWNDESIVVNAVMMYCLDNDFRQASRIAVNFLPDDDERFDTFRLMLRAFNCEYKEPEVRDGIAAISPMNAVAMYIAQNQKEYYQMADSLLKIDSLFDQSDSRVPYLKAICRYRTESDDCEKVDVRHYSSLNIYDPNPYGGEKSMDWAAPMLKAFEMDEANVEYIKNDGFFNDAYRHLVLYIWKRMKDGLTIEQATAEYDALWNKVGDMKK